MKFQNKHKVQTKDMLNINKIRENNFGYWDYLKYIKPSSGIMTTEGMIMYRRNLTKGWLDDLQSTNLPKFDEEMTQARKQRRKWQSLYAERWKLIQSQLRARMEAQ